MFDSIIKGVNEKYDLGDKAGALISALLALMTEVRAAVLRDLSTVSGRRVWAIWRIRGSVRARIRRFPMNSWNRHSAKILCAGFPKKSARITQ